MVQELESHTRIDSISQANPQTADAAQDKRIADFKLRISSILSSLIKQVFIGVLPSGNNTPPQTPPRTSPKTSPQVSPHLRIRALSLTGAGQTVANNASSVIQAGSVPVADVVPERRSSIDSPNKAANSESVATGHSPKLVPPPVPPRNSISGPRKRTCSDFQMPSSQFSGRQQLVGTQQQVGTEQGLVQLGSPVGDL